VATARDGTREPGGSKGDAHPFREGNALICRAGEAEGAGDLEIGREIRAKLVKFSRQQKRQSLRQLLTSRTHDPIRRDRFRRCARVVG